MRRSTRVVTELKNVSASSGRLWSIEQPDVDQLRELPLGVVERLGAEIVAQPRHVLEHARVVEPDPLLDEALHPSPVTGLERLLRLRARRAEELVVAVEAVQQLLGDSLGGLH